MKEGQIQTLHPQPGKTNKRISPDKYNISPTHTTWSNGNTTYVLNREEILPVMKNNSYSTA